MPETEERCRHPFKLRPYAWAGHSRSLTLGGSVCRFPGALGVEYQLEGDLQSVVFPAFSPGILRRHELWRQTCFEIFFGIPGELPYWEANLGPDGCWNLYHFTGYRRAMVEELAVETLTCRIARECNKFSLSCRIDMRKLVADGTPLEVGIAGVVFDTSGTAAYWAIDHCESVPDFHSRSSFQMLLPGLAYL